MVAAARYPGLQQCPECAFRTADMSLTRDEIEALYGHDYFHGSEYGDYIRERAALQSNFRPRIAEILALSGIDGSKTLYEIGCAYGFFLDIARNHFTQVAGTDISRDAIQYAQQELQLQATCGDFVDVEPPFAPDVICMWDVIEHLEHPDAVVAKAAETLRPGGYLCLTTGDIGSLVARWRGPKWRMVHPPTHLHYFASGNITRLLERHGLTVTSVTHPPVIRTIGTMLHGVVKLRMGADRLYSALSRLPGQNLPVPINLFDIMSVIARKTP
jgi:SAM-dependent methyltransferase